MKKIPTIFERDWNGDRSRVVNTPHKDCGWVFAGEGVATVKLDGMCAAVIDGALWRRREVRGDAPAGFVLADTDSVTGKSVGWVPVGDGPEDKWFREAWDEGGLPDGTYELVGPKSQGGIEHTYVIHTLVRHGSIVVDDEPERTFEGLRDWLAGKDMEGLVFYHPGGRMAKIKLRDFGLRRGEPN